MGFGGLPGVWKRELLDLNRNGRGGRGFQPNKRRAGIEGKTLKAKTGNLCSSLGVFRNH